VGEWVACAREQIALDRQGGVWPYGDNSPAASLAPADGHEETVEIHVIDRDGDDLTGADGGLQHEPDDGLVASVVERSLDVAGG
jgi:hypothetical protein